MARLKEKIKELQTKYSISEEAARDILALHDNDLTDASAAVSDLQEKVVKWNQWYAENAPGVTASLQELEALKSKVAALEAAGIKIDTPALKPNEPTPKPQGTPAELEALLTQRDQAIYSNFSAVQKDLYNIQRYHMQHYKELPDIDPIEKLINERKLTPWAAYQEWVKPMETKRTEDELREKITKELTEKFQNEATRSGVNGFLLSNRSATTGEEVTSPLDEVIRGKAEEAAKVTPKPGDAPSDLELMADFVGTMRNGRAGVTH